MGNPAFAGEAAETTGRAVAFAHADASYSLAMQPGDVLSERRQRSGPIECCDDMLRRSLQRAQTNPTCWLARAATVRDSGGCDERVFIQDYSIELRLAARGGFAQLREAVFCSPGGNPRAAVRQSGANPSHDMHSALVNFVAEHPGLPRDLVRLGFRRAAARAWAWARRRGGKGYASSEFRLACGARRPDAADAEDLQETCTPFAATNSIRVPAAASSLGAFVAILFKTTPAAMARWRPHLPAAFPKSDIRHWPELGDKPAIDYALVWHPETGLLASLPNLKLIVSLGAGIDHILRDPNLPRGVPILRLVDPHMTEAMSEYVAF